MNDNPRLRDQALSRNPSSHASWPMRTAYWPALTRAPASGFSINIKDLGRPLKDLEICYRPAELGALIEQAYAERRPVILTSVERRVAHGEILFLDVVVTPLFENGQQPLGAAVSFIDVTRTTNQELRLRSDELNQLNALFTAAARRSNAASPAAPSSPAANSAKA